MLNLLGGGFYFYLGLTIAGPVSIRCTSRLTGYVSNTGFGFRSKLLLYSFESTINLLIEPNLIIKIISSSNPKPHRIYLSRHATRSV